MQGSREAMLYSTIGLLLCKVPFSRAVGTLEGRLCILAGVVRTSDFGVCGCVQRFFLV